MNFVKTVKIPEERVAVLIGRSGSIKAEIEKRCHVELDIDGQTGQVKIRAKGDIDIVQPFKAVEIVTAIGRGFSPENALRLLEVDNTLHIVDIREFAGKSSSNIERIKGRIIGEKGRSRRNMENLTNTLISVYGKTVSIIGEPSQLRMAIDAVSSISKGSVHGAVYSKLEAINRRRREERMKLWEERDVVN